MRWATGRLRHSRAHVGGSEESLRGPELVVGECFYKSHERAGVGRVPKLLIVQLRKILIDPLEGVSDFHITRVVERSDTELVAEKVFPFIHDGSTNAVQTRYRIRFIPELVSARHRSITSGLGENKKGPSRMSPLKQASPRMLRRLHGARVGATRSATGSAPRPRCAVHICRTRPNSWPRPRVCRPPTGGCRRLPNEVVVIW